MFNIDNILKLINPKTAELNLTDDITEEVEVEVKLKYDGYIKRQYEQVELSSKADRIKIPENIDYEKKEHISTGTKAYKNNTCLLLNFYYVLVKFFMF